MLCMVSMGIVDWAIMEKHHTLLSNYTEYLSIFEYHPLISERMSIRPHGNVVMENDKEPAVAMLTPARTIALWGALH